MLDVIFPSAAAVLALVGIGVFFGLLLSAANIKLKVEKDPRIELIKEALPGANCGACGLPGCSGYAAKIVQDNYKITLCPVGGSECVSVIASIMGIETSEAMVSLKARIHCCGGNDVSYDHFLYSGPKSCQAAVSVLGGPKVCSYGCLGFGDCSIVCQFGAINMNSSGIPVVDEKKCTGCKSCVFECPREIISLVPAALDVWVMCKNRDKLSVMKKGCLTGCTGCKLCEKNCPEAAVTVTSFCADIDYAKCTACMKCAEVCTVAVVHPAEKSTKRQKSDKPEQENTESVQT
ncbi:MAG: RnfABCDGE type electron transport complex subunit B [Leptospirales bacterium]|nr:RnfABCDGE type electron transport complex subunit B [Leptospirales bacterium]